MRIDKISEKKQKMINEFLSLPIKVGETVEINRNLVSFLYNVDNTSTYNVTIKEVLSDDEIYCSFNECGYENTKIKIKKSDIISRHGLYKVGVNPLIDFNNDIRTVSYSLDSIVYTLELLDKRHDKPYIFDGVVCNEVNWNPYIYEENGDKKYYQRDFCWSLEDKQNLIDSLYNGINLGVIVVRKRSWKEIERLRKNGETELAFRDIVDGKQRLNALKGFLNDEFCDIYGNYFSDLSDYTKNKILDSQCLQYAEMSESTKDCNVLKQFLKLNFSGVPQSKEHLDYVKSLL